MQEEELMKIAIIDDDIFWREKIKKTLHRILPEDTLDLYIFETGIEYLKSNIFYDITLVDIEMPIIDGFDTIYKAREKKLSSVFIILTTHTELSRKGYLVDAFRYIDKSNIELELKEAIESTCSLLRYNKKITVNIINEGIIKIALKDIIFIETAKPNILIHTNSKDILCSNTMTEINDMLDDKLFFQSHKSFIINLDEIEYLEGRILHMSNGMSADVAKGKFPKFKQLYINRIYERANA